MEGGEGGVFSDGWLSLSIVRDEAEQPIGGADGIGQVKAGQCASPINSEQLVIIWKDFQCKKYCNSLLYKLKQLSI